MFRRIGKQGKVNLRANQKLKKIYQEKGINSCEIKLDGCLGNMFCGFAHRKKRQEYYKTPELLSDFNETLLACVKCHQKIEGNRKLTEEIFNARRN